MSIEVADEYGLSSDSLRGSHNHIRPDLVGSEDSRDVVTGRPNPRATLSRNEILVLEQNGILVDADGYEREPEPVIEVAPIPLATPRVRKQDRAPAYDDSLDKTDSYPDASPVPTETSSESFGKSAPANVPPFGTPVVPEVTE